ncbi:RNA polymerase sigma factor [Marinicrinis lubricantis]|uniref:RNA polymerase sigma factor n=1 Tax=Marinicrinis lubricantis TaxID=2086470 RepID=A0ABW1IKT5_9BACL
MSRKTTKELPNALKHSGQLQQLHAALHRYCISLTKSTWDAEDLAQETWLKTLKALEGRTHANIEAFMLRTAKNQWIDKSRKTKVEQQFICGLRPGDTEPLHETLHLELALHALVELLTPLQRTVFMLREVLEYSIAETAEKLLMTEGAVKAALHRARKSLKNVKGDVDLERLPQPISEEEKSHLQELAAAYLEGDTTLLIQLLWGNMEVHEAAQMVQGPTIQFTGSMSPQMGMYSVMQMAA